MLEAEQLGRGWCKLEKEGGNTEGVPGIMCEAFTYVAREVPRSQGSVPVFGRSVTPSVQMGTRANSETQIHAPVGDLCSGEFRDVVNDEASNGKLVLGLEWYDLGFGSIEPEVGSFRQGVEHTHKLP